MLTDLIQKGKREALRDRSGLGWGTYGLDMALQAAFRHNSTEVADMIVNDKELYRKYQSYTGCLLPIIYDKPDALNKLLGHMHSRDEVSTHGKIQNGILDRRLVVDSGMDQTRTLTPLMDKL